MTDVRGARSVRLLQDPALSGDVLLVGLAMAAWFDFGWDCGRTVGDLANYLWPDVGGRSRGWRVREAFKKDIRTYKPPEMDRTCSAPMQRREGPCGRPAVTSGYLVDWATGERRSSCGCGRHRAWADARHRANWSAKPEVVPMPYANHGGALRVHFPQIKWPVFWRKLDPRWVEHPEGIAWPKPTLSLVLGDDVGEGQRDRPLLTAVQSIPATLGDAS